MEILVLKGLPGSGKSTFAKKHVEDNPSYIRVNKDDIRAMLFGTYDYNFDKQREGLVSLTQTSAVTAAIAQGYSVVIDNTHLGKKSTRHWERLAEQNGYDFRVKEMDTPIEECIRRDSLRDRVVGEKTIRMMDKHYSNCRMV